MSASISAILFLYLVIYRFICVYLYYANVLSTSFAAHLLLIYLDYILFLYHLYFVFFIYICMNNAMPMLSHLLLYLRLCLLYLYLVRVFCGESAICIFGLSTLFTFFLPYLLCQNLHLLCYTYVGYPLHCLYLHLVCLCLVNIFCDLSIIYMSRTSTLFAFSVFCLLRLCLHLLRLYLYLYLFFIMSVLLVFYFIFTL